MYTSSSCVTSVNIVNHTNGYNLCLSLVVINSCTVKCFPATSSIDCWEKTTFVAYTITIQFVTSGISPDYVH